MFLKVRPFVAALKDLRFLVLGQPLFSGLSEVRMAGFFVDFKHILNRHLRVNLPAWTLVLIDDDSAQARGPLEHPVLRLLEDFLDVLLCYEVKGECLFGSVPGIGRTVCITR